MDSGFDQNQSELGILVLSVSLQVLSDSDSLLDQVVQVFGDLWSQTVGLQDSQDLVTSDNLGLGNSVGISQDNTDLRRSQTLSGVLDDLLNDVVGGQLEPSWSVSRVRSSGGRNSFSLKLVGVYEGSNIVFERMKHSNAEAGSQNLLNGGVEASRKERTSRI